MTQDLDPLHKKLCEQQIEIKNLILKVVKRRNWKCSDGYEHPRPDKFSARRLQLEVLSDPRSRDWSGSSISNAIYELIDSGHFILCSDLKLKIS